jgi:hypothetical protein
VRAFDAGAVRQEVAGRDLERLQARDGVLHLCLGERAGAALDHLRDAPTRVEHRRLDLEDPVGVIGEADVHLAGVGLAGQMPEPLDVEGTQEGVVRGEPVLALEHLDGDVVLLRRHRVEALDAADGDGHVAVEDREERAGLDAAAEGARHRDAEAVRADVGHHDVGDRGVPADARGLHRGAERDDAIRVEGVAAPAPAHRRRRRAAGCAADNRRR